MLIMLFSNGLHAPHRKALCSQKLINNSAEGFEMPSTNINKDCKPYSCKNSMGK